MRITEGQMAQLELATETSFKRQLIPHVTAYFPTIADVCGEVGVARIIDEGIASARGRGFVGRASARSLLDLTLLLGAEFDRDPLLAFAPPHLDWDRARADLAAARAASPDRPVGVVAEDYEPDPIDMLQALYDDAWAWLDVTAGPNFTSLYRALARFRVLLSRPAAIPADTGAIAALCRQVFPEKAAVCPDAALEAFLHAAAARAAAAALAPGRGHAIHAVHCFIGGIGAFDDPAFAIGDRRLADLPDEGAARTEAYGAFVLDYIDRLLASARAHAGEAV